MAYDIAPAFSDKIDKERVKEMGMGDAAWDRAVVDALGGEMTAEKSEWTVEKIASLPDSSFTYVEPGGTKDASGRTTPLSLRCLPYKDASGQVDHEQLRLAIASVPKANLPASTKARVLAKLEAAEKDLGVEKVGWTDEAREAAALARQHGERTHGGGAAMETPFGSFRTGHDVMQNNETGKYRMRVMNGPIEIFSGPARGTSEEAEQDGKEHMRAVNPGLANNMGYSKPKKSKDGVEKYITHSGDKWNVHAESGKVLGTHGSEADARAQLAAVEIGKHPKKDVHWPVDDSRFRGSSQTDAGERAPNQPRKSEGVEKEWSDAAREAAAEARRMHSTAQSAGWKKAPAESQKIPGSTRYHHPDHSGHNLHIDNPNTMGGRVSRGAQWSHGRPDPNDPQARRGTGDASMRAHFAEFHGRGHDPGKHGEISEYHPYSPGPSKKFLGEVREAVKAKAGPGSRVQTLVFDKEKYPKAEDAQGWASDHGFKSEEVDETGESFRLRQEDPGAFVRMRTISLTEGVGAVVGFPKRSIDAIKDAFFTTASGRLAFKAEDLAAAEFEPVEESASGVVYRVKVGDLVTYLAESGGVAAPLPMYRELQKTSYVPISKSSDEKRYTLGVVYPASKKGTPEPDFHGDVMSEDEIEKSAWGFMSKGNDRVGLMHRPGTTGAGRVVESYVYRGPSYKLKDATGQEQEISPGDWMLGVVWEPEAWKAIKSGTITGYSLQGAARKTLFGSEE